MYTVLLYKFIIYQPWGGGHFWLDILWWDTIMKGTFLMLNDKHFSISMLSQPWYMVQIYLSLQKFDLYTIELLVSAGNWSDWNVNILLVAWLYIDILILFCDNGSFSIGILHWKFMGPISKAKFNTEGCAWLGFVLTALATLATEI